jgi:hypothetical protein
MAVRDLHWAMSEDGERFFGRFVEFGDRTGQEHLMSVKLVSPRMLLEFLRPEDVWFYDESPCRHSVGNHAIPQPTQRCCAAEWVSANTASRDGSRYSTLRSQMELNAFGSSLVG